MEWVLDYKRSDSHYFLRRKKSNKDKKNLQINSPCEKYRRDVFLLSLARAWGEKRKISKTPGSMFQTK